MSGLFTWILGTRVGRWVGRLLAGLALLLTAYGVGRREQANRNKVRGMEDYVDTRKRMDQNPTVTDPDAADQWLRDRANKRGVRRDKGGA